MSRYDMTLSYYNNNALEFAASSINANMVALCDRFLEFLPLGTYILDLGCGTGRDSRYFRSKGYRVQPLDGSYEMCRIATETSGVKAIQMRFDELEFAKMFDGVWACASLLHVSIEKLPSIMKRINCALKCNGIVYMSFKYGDSAGERNGRLFTDMTEKDINILCNKETGFVAEDILITEDVRQSRHGEYWLNIFARKI